jgi:hypothetical protein
MSFTDIITVTSSLIAIISGIAVFVGYISKNFKDKRAIRIIMITALIITLFLTGSIALTVGLSRPVVAINHYVSPPLPGHPAQPEANYNTVVVATVPIDVTRTIIENRTLTCVSCNSGLKVLLDSVVISTNQSKMTWNFTINGTNGCSNMNVAMYIEDPVGNKTNAGPPGTLTENNPLGAGQTLSEYATIALTPKAGVPYAMHTTPYCTPYSDTDQVETFTF